MSNWRRQGAFIGEKVPENGSFWDQLCRDVGFQPRSGASDTHKPYTDELQILSILCMPMHGFATAVKVVTPDQLRDRVGCAYLIYPVQGGPRSWSAADSPNLCTNLKLRVHQLDNICSSHS